jgi:hypothetical protein
LEFEDFGTSGVTDTMAMKKRKTTAKKGKKKGAKKGKKK